MWKSCRKDFSESGCFPTVPRQKQGTRHRKARRRNYSARKVKAWNAPSTCSTPTLEFTFCEPDRKGLCSASRPFSTAKQHSRQSLLVRNDQDSARIKLVGASPSLTRRNCRTYGKFGFDLESTGKIINNDLWIAAHALASGLILVTNNEKDFRRVRGLKIQNGAAKAYRTTPVKGEDADA